MTQFRERALAEIDRVSWIPEWGVNRIKSAVQTPSRLVHLAPTLLGRADSRVLRRRGRTDS